MFFHIVFCILVYKNTEDIIDCLESISKKIVSGYRVVIVNSFFDEQTEEQFKKVALEYNCDFVSVPNKGYGYGNNKGIEYIREKYSYDYLIISNPDIVINFFDDSILDDRNAVYAPIICNKSGKKQNPYWFKKNSLAEYLLYCGMKKKSLFVYYVGVAINKLIREILLFFFGKSNSIKTKIYAAHGSFMILGNNVIDAFDGKLFDENMFLFAEEAYLSHQFENCAINTYLVKNIDIFHKEDGSVGLANIDEMKIQAESIKYYYEKYVIGRKKKW